MKHARRPRNGFRGIAVSFLLILCGGCSEMLVPDPNVRFIAFGDSSTASNAEADYWEYVRDKLAEPADSFAGQGQGGETAAEGLPRLEQLISSDIYPNAQVLLYWQGGDDLIRFVQNRDPLLVLSPDSEDYPYTAALTTKLDEIQHTIERAIQAGQGAGWRVYVMTYYLLKENQPCRPLPLPVLLAPQAANANAYVVRLNDRIRRAANNRQATLIDVAALDPALRSNAANYANCNHLSAQGNERVADLVTSVLSGG